MGLVRLLLPISISIYKEITGKCSLKNELSLAFVTFSFKGGFINAAPMAAYCMVFGGFTFIYFYVIPTLDRIDAKLDAFNKEMKQQRNERRHAALDSMGSQIEARDVVGEFSKGQRIQASGISLIYSSFSLAAHMRIEFQTLSSLLSD